MYAGVYARVGMCAVGSISFVFLRSPVDLGLIQINMLCVLCYVISQRRLGKG